MAKKTGYDQPGLRDYQEGLSAACRSLPALCGAVGPDAFLRARAVKMFHDAWLAEHPGGDVVTIRGTGEARPARIADVTREFVGGSLFSRDKLVVVRAADRIFFPGSQTEDDGGRDSDGAKSGGADKAFLERLDAPPSGSWLILDFTSLPKNRTMGKRLAEKLVAIPCPQPNARDIPLFLRERANEQKRGLTPEAAELLLRAYGTELGVLAAEVEKLALFAPDGRDIDAAMVKEFLTGTVEYDIFAFTNAIEARNAREALYYVRRITSQGARGQKGKREDGEKTSHMVMVIVSGTIGLMLRAKIAAARGISSDEFAREDKQSPWRGRMLYEAAARYSLPELRRFAAYMADMVRRSHDTGGNVQLALETAAVVLTRQSVACNNM